MKPNGIKAFIARLMRSQKRVSVLLLGGQGVGKTTAVMEAAQEEAERRGLRFVDYSDDIADEILRSPDKYFVFHDLPLVGVEPVDLTGQPRLHNGTVRYYPLTWALVMSRCQGVLFLDDFLDTQRMDVMSAAYRIFLQRRVGYLYLHPEVQVVAASNTPEFSTLSQMMPAPLANRAVILTVDPPSPLEWARWMEKRHRDGWDRRIFAFLKRFEGEGYIFKPPKEAETLEQHPTPRSWTMLATLLAEGLVGEEEMSSIVGEEMAQKLRAFLSLKVDLEELAAKPSAFPRLGLDAKYVVAIMLASELTENNYQKFSPLVEEMTKDSMEWMVIMITSMTSKRREKILTVLGRKNGELLDKIQKAVSDRDQL